jgi:hypothetical protein
MQRHLRELQKMLKIDEIYQSKVFTIVRVSMAPDLSKPNAFPREPYFAEGLARKSSTEEMSDKIGIDVATGRAVKAIFLKLRAHNPNKPIGHRFMG